MLETAYTGPERRRQTATARLYRRLVHIFRECQSEPIETTMGLLVAVLGAWLALPLMTFESTAAYRHMGTVAEEPIWGAVLVGIGAWTLFAVLNGFLPYRSWGMGLCTGASAFFAIGFALGNPVGVGVPVFVVTTGAAGWAFIHLRWRMHHARHRGEPDG